MSKDNNDAVMEGLKALRAVAEKAGADSAESKELIAKIGKETAEKLELSQKDFLKSTELANTQASQIKKLEDDIAAMQKKANRPTLSEGGNPIQAKYAAMANKYLRKGVPMSPEAIKEIATFMVKSNTCSDDEQEINHAIHTMVSEQGVEDGKGFYIFPTNVKLGMVEGSNPDGGYTVLPDRRTDVRVTRIFETSPIRAFAQIITTGGMDVEIPIDDDQSASGGWVGETDAPSDTANAKLGLLKIPVHEQYAQPKLTQRLLDDSQINIEQWLSDKTNDILTRTENTAFVAGTGASQPKGILQYAAWASAGVYEREKIERVLSGISATFTSDFLRKLQGALLEDYQANAIWLTKRDNFTTISLLKDGQGRYMLNERMLSDGVDTRVLGKPLYFANDVPAAGADSLSIIYGDFKRGYTIVDRQGIRVLRDPYTSKPYIKFYTTKRVGGAVSNYQSLKVGQLT